MGDVWLHMVKDELQAETSYKEGLRLWHDLHQVEQGMGIVKRLAGMAEIAVAQRQAERAGRLFGAAARGGAGSKWSIVPRKRMARIIRSCIASWMSGWSGIVSAVSSSVAHIWSASGVV
jgi:hypothetical protein